MGLEETCNQKWVVVVADSDPVGFGTGEEKHNDRGELVFGVRCAMRWYGSSFMMHMSHGVWDYGMMCSLNDK